MSEKPTFGRYAEIPVDKMSPEQREGYKAMLESRVLINWRRDCKPRVIHLDARLLQHAFVI